jgi:hypothetical protein
VPSESRASPSRQSQLTASCGCVREAPPKDLTLRSGRERAATLAAPTGHDRASGTSAHPQAEAMHAGSAPVIRLEGPLALGHDVLLVVLPSGRSDVSHGLVCGSTGGGLGAAGRRGPQVVRVAAVSPTFGRLFEGTDEASPGQTWPAATKPRPLAGKIFRFGHTRRGRGYHNEPKQAPRTLNDPIGMQQNGWQPNGKLLASAKSI